MIGVSWSIKHGHINWNLTHTIKDEVITLQQDQNINDEQTEQRGMGSMNHSTATVQDKTCNLVCKRSPSTTPPCLANMDYIVDVWD